MANTFNVCSKIWQFYTKLLKISVSYDKIVYIIKIGKKYIDGMGYIVYEKYDKVFSFKEECHLSI